MSFFKLVMIVLLKIYAAGKMFGKMYLKAIRNTIFSNMWRDQQREGGLGVIFNRQVEFKLLVFLGDPLPLFLSLSVIS